MMVIKTAMIQKGAPVKACSMTPPPVMIISVTQRHTTIGDDGMEKVVLLVRTEEHEFRIGRGLGHNDLDLLADVGHGRQRNRGARRVPPGAGESVGETGPTGNHQCSGPNPGRHDGGVDHAVADVAATGEESLCGPSFCLCDNDNSDCVNNALGGQNYVHRPLRQRGSVVPRYSPPSYSFSLHHFPWCKGLLLDCCLYPLKITRAWPAYIYFLCKPFQAKGNWPRWPESISSVPLLSIH